MNSQPRMPLTPLREVRNASFEECKTPMDIQRWYRKTGRKGWIFVDKDNPFANPLLVKAITAQAALAPDEDNN